MDENQQGRGIMAAFWQHIKQHRVAISIAVAVLLIVGGGIATWLWGLDWTGLNGGFGKITTTTTSNGTTSTTTEKPPWKTLWDVLQLLIIPIVLLVGGYRFNVALKKREQEATSDTQREAALQAYIDKMSDLLLKEHLRERVSEKQPPYDGGKPFLKWFPQIRSGNSQIPSESKPEDEAQTIARARTLTVLRRLDAGRKRSLLQFLYESKLIDKDERIIALRGADLQGADLQGVDLHGAHLGGVDLRKADLRNANLSDITGCDKILVFNARQAGYVYADLRGADLRNADLGGADLKGVALGGADLRGAKLDGADLRGTDLSGADLHDTTLRSANLYEGIITPEQEKIVGSLTRATMPDGSNHR